MTDRNKNSSVQVQLIYQKLENLRRNVIIYGRYTQPSILESHMGAPKRKKGMLFLKCGNQLMSKF